MTDGGEMVRRRAQVAKGSVVEAWPDMTVGGGTFWVGDESKTLLDAVGPSPMAAKLSLPADGLKPGKTWERTYTITLNPPLGTGEKYDVVQRFTCKALSADQATVALTTELKTPPKVAADAIPLWQMLPAGDVVFDLKAGRVQSATLKIDRELKGHQGEGSACRFQSTYTIRYVGDR